MSTAVCRYGALGRPWHLSDLRILSQYLGNSLDSGSYSSSAFIILPFLQSLPRCPAGRLNGGVPPAIELS